jgi:RNA polymerase sigma-70 factor (ECF subfamily)
LRRNDPTEARGSFDGPSPEGDAPLSDRAVIEGVRRRDPDALRRVYDAAFPHVYGLAYRLSGNRVRAEDIAQDVFLKVYRGAHRLDPDRSMKPWLSTVTLNAFRDRMRRRSRRSETAVDPTTIDALGHTSDDPEYGLVKEERRRALEMCIRALEAKLRESVVLRAWSGHSHGEVAGLLGITAAAARKRYSRALAQLKACLGEPNDE